MKQKMFTVEVRKGVVLTKNKKHSISFQSNKDASEYLENRKEHYNAKRHYTFCCFGEGPVLFFGRDKKGQQVSLQLIENTAPYESSEY